VRGAAFAFAAALVPGAPAFADNAAEVMELGRVEVVGTTPLPGVGTPLADVPANVQSFGADALARRRPSSIASFLDRNAAGFSIGDAQGNPFQPDVSFRGFSGSPLLGVPQGIAVFQDGVRVNEPFGDIVNWDLIPPSAIGSVQLLPGATAAFGRNALAGALAVYTKSGSSFPGGAIEAEGGSFGRRSLMVEHGLASGPWDLFATADAIDDHGWAEHNPSRVRRFFGKLGHQTGESDLDIALTLADDTLQGTQTLPLPFLDDIRQAYTWPDRNENRLRFLTAKGSVFVGGSALLGANGYARRYRNDSLASNVNDDAGDDGAPPAFNDRSTVDQSSAGAGVQLTFEPHGTRRPLRFVAGGNFDRANVRFTRFEQPAEFTQDRGTRATGDFALATDAATRDEERALFGHATLGLGGRWILDLSARRQETRTRIEDRSGADPRLDGSHRFARTLPSAGLAWRPSEATTVYGSYSEGMRAPTAMELTCADPGAPCKLPNEFLSDPPLDPVLSRSAEAGARGRAGAWEWSAAAYRTDLRNDIQFVQSGTSTAGFFMNVGRTRREGLELGARTKRGAIAFDLRYGYVRATFLSGFQESSAGNSTADADGAISVHAGNRIPAIPPHTLKLRLEYASTERWSVEASVRAASAAYARGDENNRDASGRVPGYAVLDLDARWIPVRDVELFARIDNVFDVRYATFGILGTNFFTGPGRSFAPENRTAAQFRGTGAPFGAWLGARYAWR
jgi:outer membrane receptor protein involved in Fe transport